MINIGMADSNIEQIHRDIENKQAQQVASASLRSEAAAAGTTTSNMMTITDDMGNTITFDKTNPNPEGSAAFSTSSYGSNAPVAPDPNYQDAAAASDAGNMGSYTSSGGGMRDSNTMDATNTYGSAAEVAGAGSDIGNLGSSVSSSLGGITSKGEAFSAATDAAKNTASGDLSNTLNSIPSGQFSSVFNSLPNVGGAAQALASAGNISGLANKLSGGLSPTAITSLSNSINVSNLANAAKTAGGQVSTVLNIGDKVNDAGTYAKNLATSAAANTGLPSTVSINGKSVTEQPPARPMDIVQKAAGTPMAVVPPEARTAAHNVQTAMKTMGTSGNNDEASDGAKQSPSMPVNGTVSPFGAIRDSRAVIPGMEAILFDVPKAALSKFTSLLPPVFKTLLPLGVIAGVVSKGPISLGGLTQLVGGAALGAIASQSLRSVGGINAVSGMTGVLGAQALSRASGSGAIPVNIATTFGNALLSRSIGSVAGNVASNVFGSSPATAAVISNVVGIVSNVALNKNIAGIPVSSQILGLAANVALRNAGVPIGIPTGVLGSAAGMANNPLGSIVGSLVSGRVPVLPTNLSLGNVGALSGLTQQLQSVGLAENIIPRSQLAGLLPPNLSNQVRSSVPPRMQRPGYMNEAEDKNRSATTKTSDSELQPRTGSDIPAKPAVLQGQINGQIPYGAKISKHFTLGQLSNAAIFKHNIVPQNGLSVDQIIAGLSWIATNILDAYIDGGKGGFTLNSGFRGPGGSNPTGDHGRGAAVDIQWGNDRKKHHDMALWTRQNGIPAGLVILEKPGSANWLHLAGGTGHPTARFPKTGYANQTWYGGSYLSGFLMP